MKLETVVIGTDFSAHSIATAKWVATTLAPDAEIVLAHAIERPAVPSFLVADTLPADALAIAARAEATDRARDIASLVRSEKLRVEIRIGAPHEVIGEIAEECRADMIAVGAHGERSRESPILGTTADRLVRSAHIPVLIGARRSHLARGRVLAGVDDEAVTVFVLTWANLMAKRLDARLSVLHVLSDSSYSHMASLAAAHAHGSATIEGAEVRGELQWQVQRWIREATASGVDASRVDAEVMHGDAAEEIVGAARREGATVIVVGRRPSVYGMPALLGRTVRRVLHDASCSVLVVPPPTDTRSRLAAE